MSTPVINAINNVNDSTLNSLFQAVANNASARESLSQSNRNVDAVTSNLPALRGLGDNAGQDEAIRLCLCRRSGRDPANFPNTATDIIQDGTFRGEILGDAILSGLLSASQPGVAEIVSSATLSSELAASQTAMQEVAASQTAMQEVVASQTAMQEVAASQTAMQVVAASQAAMEDVAASQTAMQEVLASQTARDEVFASQTAMQEVAASQTAMQEVAASQTAMQEVAASQIAMQEVGLSGVAKTEVLDSSTALTELDNASTTSSFSETKSRDESYRIPIAATDEVYEVYISNANYTGTIENAGCINNAGWFDSSGNSLGTSLDGQFVDELAIGWDGLGQCSATSDTMSGNINALTF